MRRLGKGAVGLALLVCWSAGCARLGDFIKPPIIVDSRTALENQVLGEYEPLSEDLLLIASLPGVARRAVEERAAEPPADEAEFERVRNAQERLVRALLSQEYNRDDLDRFLREGWLGEAMRGAVHVFAERIEEVPPHLRERLRLLAEEENRDRESLIDAVIEISPALGPSDRKEIEEVFARQYFGEVPAGSWVERAAGGWVRVEAGRQAGGVAP